MALVSRGRISCASSLGPFIQLLGNYSIVYTEADSKRGTKLRRESRTNCLRKCRIRSRDYKETSSEKEIAALIVKAHGPKQKQS